MPNKLEDDDWELLLDRIKDGNCTPFLGAGVCAGKIPFGSHFARKWADKFDYPMEDSYDLMRVAQFVTVKLDDNIAPKEKMCKEIEELLKNVKPEHFEKPNEPHGVLAGLPLPIYITTNYDDLIVRALKSYGKTPIQEICLWHDELKQLNPMSSDFVPTPETPLVFHLHGFYKIPESLVLTEDDYLDFLAAISMEQNLLPPRIQEAFTETSLLFLGYKIADWDFKVLFRLLKGYLKRRRRKHISVQIVGDLPETKKEKAQKYLDNYFEDLNIQVYWQDCREFAVELETRWERAEKEWSEKEQVEKEAFNGVI